jgi:hypothetical protein
VGSLERTLADGGASKVSPSGDCGPAHPGSGPRPRPNPDPNS